MDLQVIDVSGIQHAYVGPYRSKVTGKTYHDVPWFTETLINGVHVSDLFTGYRNTPHFVVAVTDPLKSYVLRATINSSMFNALLHSAQLGPQGDAFIVNRNGELQTPSLQGKTELSETERRLISSDSTSTSLVTSTDVYTARWIANGQWLLCLRANILDSLGYYLAAEESHHSHCHCYINPVHGRCDNDKPCFITNYKASRQGICCSQPAVCTG